MFLITIDSNRRLSILLIDKLLFCDFDFYRFRYQSILTVELNRLISMISIDFRYRLTDFYRLTTSGISRWNLMFRLNKSVVHRDWRFDNSCDSKKTVMMTLIMSSVLVGKIATVKSTAAAGSEKLKKKKMRQCAPNPVQRERPFLWRIPCLFAVFFCLLLLLTAVKCCIQVVSQIQNFRLVRIIQQQTLIVTEYALIIREKNNISCSLKEFITT